MGEFKIDGRMKVKKLRDTFKKEFGATLRVYYHKHFADDDATLASIRAEGCKGGEITVGSNTKVGNFEKKVMDLYGIEVQVAVADDSKLANNNGTIAAAGKD